MSNLFIKRLKGHEIDPYIPDLARLRKKIFYDYPYLYEGTIEYEENYLKTYTNCPDSILILVLANDQVVGASTAIPLKNEMQEVQAPFIHAKMNINDIFYLGESVLLHEYRGQKIYPQLFAEREAAAREQGFKITTFCAVTREPHHPKQPKNWKPLDPFWQSMGYTRHPELQTYFSWQEIGETEETAKPMVFWLKQL